MNSSENKNLILAMSLMLAVWLGFTILFPPQKKETQPIPEKEVQQESVQEQKDSLSVQNQTGDISNLDQEEKVVHDYEETAVQERSITIETDKYQAVFTNRGAKLVSFKLKNYRASADLDAPPVQMFEPGPNHYATLRTTGKGGFSLSGEAQFSTASDSLIRLQPEDSMQLVFKHVAANGVEYYKTFLVDGNSYIIDTALKLVNNGATQVNGNVDFALVQRWDESMKPDSYTFSGPATLIQDEIDQVDVDDLSEGSVAYGQNVAWTSFQTKYFLSVVVPETNTAERVEIQQRGDAIENLIESPPISLNPGEQALLGYLLFIGPKDHDELKAAGHNLDKVVNFGFFNILAQPLFLVLNFFYGYFNNYGVAIILLTVLIKILFWPLTHKSYSSMKAMQKLQPEMQKLREKFSNDKERLNKEMMSLYKTHRVNPLGGCLPMLVQIPVFFALYKVLLDSIALRHAPFALWITDLSAKDPYYITPLLMGASMFVQQKMTPTTADPMQAKIFMMMPVIFTFLFLNFPSGLVIYWLVNNLLTIVQQYFIHRKKA